MKPIEELVREMEEWAKSFEDADVQENGFLEADYILEEVWPEKASIPNVLRVLHSWRQMRKALEEIGQGTADRDGYDHCLAVIARDALREEE